MTCSASTCSTVTGTCVPSSRKIRVMPSFLASNPVRMVAASDLDLDIHTGGEVELHQRVHRLRRRLHDIEQAAMCADLKLLAALLVDMRRAIDGEPLDMRRQRDRPPDPRARALGRVHDLLRAVVQHAVIVRLQANADILVVHRLACPEAAKTMPAPRVGRSAGVPSVPKR